ncbi:deoxyribodipyrimidine photo-lyase [Leptolyngbya sp. 7M]|uniref:deoxyribodipyrimidine photo-lyase n=1 Tax=Leptolyngbya sp. 7M TaxID=2812896 RepID=UPI0021F11C03|nr:deoxyribodipyrimidine photo-lyase [Leptolyngbya sp. 7M]
MTDLILFWHRRDLRTVDNIGLDAARQRSSKVIGVFCLDPNILQRDDVAPARVTYLIGSLAKLQESYAQAGSQLLILQGQPVERLPALAKALSAQAVYLNRDVEPYGRERDRTVAAALREAGVEVQAFWDQLLHAPTQVMTGSGQPYTVYTPFWRNWKSQPKAEPVVGLTQASGLSESEISTAQAETIALPTAKDLGFLWDTELPLAPGTAAAQEKLNAFCSRAIQEYGAACQIGSGRGLAVGKRLPFGQIVRVRDPGAGLPAQFLILLIARSVIVVPDRHCPGMVIASIAHL